MRPEPLGGLWRSGLGVSRTGLSGPPRRGDAYGVVLDTPRPERRLADKRFGVVCSVFDRLKDLGSRSVPRLDESADKPTLQGL